ncbi:MAG: hypothetical protein KAG89_01950 [Fulvimarina manganoxydans]|uniref:hypothetical protein n=1 Tax=Fulvimarina manganoxydans TaxID=937218 RepID=UPI002356B03F|nr:hypothetical protein [Fulvimarina manganoxydans]MCK5930909.1 hypothetical protein [Fulvimarina manganoxydans]
MITAALVFAFGFLVALLLALLLAPLVWRRAQRIARQEFEATIPANAREIRGTYDHLRARLAFDARKREVVAEERERRAALERADAGRVASENAELKARTQALSAQIAQQMAELEDLNTTLSKRENEADEIDRELRDAHHDLIQKVEELETLGARFNELSDIAEERKITLVALETRNEGLLDDLRQNERRAREANHTIDRLTSDLEATSTQLDKERQANRRLDAKVARLTTQLSDRDEQLERMFAQRTNDNGARSTRSATRSRDESAANGRSTIDARGTDRASLPAIRPEDGAPERRDTPRRGARSGYQILEEASREPVVERGQDPAPAAQRPESEESTPIDVEKAETDLSTIHDPAQLREEVAEIAARVIDVTARQEGPNSPIETILARADEDTDPRTLAGRVRSLRKDRSIQAAE